MMLPLLTQTSLSSCHCLATCQQSGCKSRAPILSNLIDSDVTSLTKPSVVRCQNTSQHTEPALVVVVHSSCIEVVQLKIPPAADNFATMCPCLSPFTLLVLCISTSGRLNVFAQKAVIKRITYPSYSFRCSFRPRRICRVESLEHIMCILFPTICLLLLLICMFTACRVAVGEGVNNTL